MICEAFRIAIVAVVALALASALGPASSAPPQDHSPTKPKGRVRAGKNVIEVVRRIDGITREKLALKATAIQSGEPVSPARDALPMDRNCARRYCNPQLNSRFPRVLPTGPWAIQWQVDVMSSPVFVIQGGGRFLTQGGGLWQLFAEDGKLVGDGPLGPSGVVLDAQHNLAYALDRSNLMCGYRLADGARAFRTSVAFGRAFSRPFVARRGSKLFIVGVERIRSPHRSAEPNRSLLQYIEFLEPMEVDETGLLLSIAGDRRLFFNTARLRAAMWEDTVVLALPGMILIADTDLNVLRSFEDNFEPVLLSLSGAGRIHLIAQVGETRFLWVLTPDGKRVINLALKREYHSLIAPPIVGYDHRVYLLTKSLLVAVDPSGKLLWERPIGAAGAGVTNDDRILVSAGNEVVVFQPDGERQTLFQIPGQTLLTPPLLTADGQILVASAERLYCLSP